VDAQAAKNIGRSGIGSSRFLGESVNAGGRGKSFRLVA
jgi:hypothetical protein